MNWRNELAPGYLWHEMKCFTTYQSEKGKHKVYPGLLWEYNPETFDWQRYRRTVVERVVSLGRLSDFYVAFDLYGGYRGIQKIVRDEAIDLSPRNLDFACHAFNLDPTETLCYKREQARKRVVFQQSDE